MAGQVAASWLTCDPADCNGVRLDSGQCLAHAEDKNHPQAREERRSLHVSRQVTVAYETGIASDDQRGESPAERGTRPGDELADVAPSPSSAANTMSPTYSPGFGLRA
jgi:hypothetical protein